MDQLFSPYPHTVFRYRPDTPLSLKEIQYGEIFFSARDELNDPYDTKSPALFLNDPKICERLIEYVMEPYIAFSELEGNLNVGLMTEVLCRKQLLLDELIEVINSRQFFDATTTSFLKMGLVNVVQHFIERFKYLLYTGAGICYIASFSKNCVNPVVWSHYANHHKGFCLCFSIHDQTFCKDEHIAKTGLHKKEHRFEEVNYKDRNVTTNGYYHFPPVVLGDNVSKEQTEEYWDLRRQSYLTKYTSWGYEQEVRLVFDDWLDIRSSQAGFLKLPVGERIFYYDQRQLTGIIFGAKMKHDYRNEIRNVVINMRERLILNSGKHLPVFVFYQARESSDSFLMNIEGVDGLDVGNRVFQISDLESQRRKEAELNERNS
ncbi:MAG: DUF2971 domain-containing protein [Bacteroidetes bacterium]|nr:DUF2971 domain-containing protein [Bacteroidota bacterium]